MTPTVSPEAATDVTVTSRHYDTKPGLYGAEFEDEFEAAVRKIGENPRLYSPVEDGIPRLEIREHLIARFEQRVIYRVDGDDVLVVAVVHASRRPGAWHRRVPPAG